MNTYFGKLPVDAGMMSIVPVELVVSGKYEKLDAAIKQMQDNPELEAADGGCAYVFRVKEAGTAYFDYACQDDVVAVIRFCVNQGGGNFTHYEIKPGLYIVTDPCYVLADPDEDRNSGNYFKLCEALMPGFIVDNVKAYLSAALALLDGQAVPVCSSGYGDGMYDLELRIDGNKIWLEVDFMREDEKEDE